MPHRTDFVDAPCINAGTRLGVVTDKGNAVAGPKRPIQGCWAWKTTPGCWLQPSYSAVAVEYGQRSFLELEPSGCCTNCFLVEVDEIMILTHAVTPFWFSQLNAVIFDHGSGCLGDALEAHAQFLVVEQELDVGHCGTSFSEEWNGTSGIVEMTPSHSSASLQLAHTRPVPHHDRRPSYPAAEFPAGRERGCGSSERYAPVPWRPTVKAGSRCFKSDDLSVARAKVLLGNLA